MKTNIIKSIITFAVVLFMQSCSSSNEKYTYSSENENTKTATENDVKNDEIAIQNEIEQAATLLLLTATADEINNASSNETYYNNVENENTNYNEEYDRGTQMIRDRIETEVGSNIVYQ